MRQLNRINTLTIILIIYTQLGLGVQMLLYLKPSYHFDCSIKQLMDNRCVGFVVVVVVFNGLLLVFIFPFKLLDYNMVPISVMRPTNSAYFIPVYLIILKMTNENKLRGWSICNLFSLLLFPIHPTF